MRKANLPLFLLFALGPVGCATVQEQDAPRVEVTADQVGVACTDGWTASGQPCWEVQSEPADDPWEIPGNPFPIDSEDDDEDEDYPQGGGEETPPPDDSPPHQTQYATARNRAACLLRNGDCAAQLSSVDHGAGQTLSDIDVRGGFDLNAPAGNDAYATTIGAGNGAEAQILLRPPFFAGASDIFQARIILHEIGHATGRIDGSHGPFHPLDPGSSETWDDRIERVCASAAQRQRCGY